MDKKKSTLHAERIRENPSELFTCPFCGVDATDTIEDFLLMKNSDIHIKLVCKICDGCWDLIYSFEKVFIIPELDEIQSSESGNDNIDEVLKSI